MINPLNHSVGPVLLIVLLLNIFSCQEPSSPVELRREVAEMLIIGFRGTTLAQSPEIVRNIKEDQIGGIILFDYDVPSKSRPRNIVSPEQLEKLCADLQGLSSKKLIIAIDQEGGFVNRLKPRYGFPPSYSAQHIAELDNLDSTLFYAKKSATLLREMNINFNFAPVVDLNVNPNCPVIGKIERSYSADPQIVSQQAITTIEGFQGQKISSCIKHFPGHGSAQNDSHKGFTDVSNSWSKIELVPFKEVINSGLCSAIMTAHIFNKNLDSLYPATLSKQTVTGLLRHELGWDGLVVSDDMDMGAITENFGEREALRLAINAGVDMLIISNNGSSYNPEAAEKAIDIIVDLVESGEISRSRIDEAYERIVDFKLNFLVHDKK